YLRDRVPPLALPRLRHWILHRLAHGPPLLRFRVRRHPPHVSVEIVTDILEVGEQQVPVAEDAVVPHVAGVDRRQHLRPNVTVNPLVRLDVLRPDADYLSVSLHRPHSFTLSTPECALPAGRSPDR